MSRLIFLFSLIFLIPGFSMIAFGQESDTEGECVTCHKELTAGLYKQWYNSGHANYQVGCLDCHKAEEGDPDAFEHMDALIATLVTPKDCGKCHAREAEEMSGSYHARAGLILDSEDAYQAHVIAGEPAAILGCESCHGARMEIDSNSVNMLSRDSWPNSGIGRINPDGSMGSCTACHTRHAFDKAQSRQPESCSKCHMGPDHPQKEVYEESKHGNTYYTNVDKMNLNSNEWVVGDDYYVSTTCASCHMSATQEQPVTHDVGNRIAWTLRPIISEHKENWKERRRNMEDVCATCHTSSHIDGHFYQFDAVVRLYNDKFARTALDIINLIREKELSENETAFGNKIDWTFWELWHHEGRRARHGASMMGPDYTWWHGFYEVGKHFYFKFIPEARELGDAEVNAYIDSLLAEDPMHNWLGKQTANLKDAIRSGEIQKIYQKYYEGE